MHKSTRTWSLLLLAALTTLSACAGPKTMLTAERPADVAFRTELKKELSSLNIAIDQSTASLATVLNQTVASELYKGPTKINGLSANISRNGAIVVSAADNFIHLSMPIAMSLNYGLFKTPTTTLNLKFKVTARVTPDWRFATEIYYLGLSDLLAEDISVGPVSIKPRTIVEGVTQPVQKVLSDLVSRKLNEKYALKPQVEKVWKAAQKPVLLDKNYSAWLKVTPQEVMLYPLAAHNNQLKLSLGFRSFAEMVVGPEPAAGSLLPLPNLKLVNSLDRNFRIALNTDLFYRDLVSIASPLLLNKDFGSEGKSVILKDFDVYGNGDRLIVKVETKGTVDGVFYLTCKPVFNPQTNMFSVEDVDFDVNSESVLLKSAAWFLHGTIRDKIHEKLNMNLTKQVERAREMAQKAVANVRLADHVYLKGSVNSIRLTDVAVQKDKISIQLYTDGESAIVFQ